MYISISVSNITPNGHHYNRHLKLILWITLKEGGSPTQSVPGLGLNASVRISRNLAVYIGLWEFESYASPAAGSFPGHWNLLQSK